MADAWMIRRSACDTCRRRKIKCDGSQPCHNCTKSGVSCTFGSATGRTSATSYAHHLEQQVASLQARLAALSDTVSLGEGVSGTPPGELVDLLVGPEDNFVLRDGSNNTNLYRHFAALNMLRAIGDMCVDPSLNVSPGEEILKAMECPSPIKLSSFGQGPCILLPSKPRLLQTASHALRTALVCHDFIDIEEVSRRLDDLYDVDPETILPKYANFLALIYALLALGKRYSGEMTAGDSDAGSESSPMAGLAYLRASCTTLSTQDLQDLDAIRAIMLQARYLLSISMTTKAYVVLSSAISAALRMGLNLSCHADGFTSEELYHRRRTFAVLNMMDTYLASMLGMSKILGQADPSQILGVREEDPADGGVSFVAQNPDSSLSETVLCEKLFTIYRRILDTKLHAAASTAKTMSVEAVTELEYDIHEWMEMLPDLSEEIPGSRTLFAQLTLRLHHAGANIMLYRPFLHHLGRCRDDQNFSISGYEYGSACVRFAGQSVFIVEAMRSHGFFHEAIWFNTYALTFSVTILAYFVMRSRQRTTIEESTATLLKAMEMLKDLGQHNSSTRRIYDSLGVVVSNIWQYT